MPSNESPGSDALIGTVLTGKYRVVREVGRGGMAAVYEARHVEIGKRVAIKILNPGLASVGSIGERFMREARAAAAIESPHICGMHDIDRLEDGRPFLVMDFLDGESLFQRLEKVGRFEPIEVVKIFSQIARGLQKAHDAGIVHRDLKPENIFLARNDEGEELAKIVDFGLAKFYEGGEGPAEKRLTRDGAIFGTPLYMSPEQVVGDGNVDYRADLWALGCMAFECLTGHAVWNNDRGLAMVLAQIAAEAVPVPSKLHPGLPAGFDAWFARALDREPERRFQSARELASELAVALGYELLRAPMKSTSALTDLTEISGRFQIVPLRSDALTEAAIDIVRVPPNAVGPKATDLRQENRSVVEVGTASPVPARSPAPRAPRAWLLLGMAAVIGAVATGFVLGLGLLSPGSGTTNGSVLPGQAALDPSTSSASARSPAPVASSSAPAPGSASPPPANAPGWVQMISQGQDELARGSIADAMKSFERAAEASDSGMTKLMLDHARIAAGSKGACRMTGLGRPRPFDQSSPARHSSVVSVGSGMLASWIDEHRGAGQPSVAAALIDSSLRTWPAAYLTPEGSSVTEAREIASGGTAALFWGEGNGPAAGVYARALDRRGVPSGDPVRVSEGRTTAAHAGAALAPSGDWWVVYDDETPKSSANLFARKLDSSLKPQGEAVQLTDFAAVDGPLGPRVTGAEAAIVGDALLLSYRIERGQKHDVMFQRIPLTDIRDVAGRSKPGTDELAGLSTRVTQTQWKVQPPEMACDKVVCLVVWRGDPSGVNIAAIDPGSGAVRWRKIVSAPGMQAGVGLDGAGHGLVAWYEDGRLRTAPVTLDGIGAGGLAGRVGGDQPTPTVVWANGSWIVAWSSFEGGHPEAYLQRVTCQ